jgi:hypothetical protein
MAYARLALFLSLASPLASAQEDGWRTYDRQGALLVERRAVAHSSFYEVRVSARAPVRPDVVMAGIWSGIVEELPKTVRKRQVLRRSDDELVLYDQIATPIVSDRDYTLVLRRAADAATGGWRVTFETANQLGPPVDRHYVRVPLIRGSWSLVPDGDGTRLVYTVYSEPGGSIPAFMARGAQMDQALIDMRRILTRAERAAVKR